ncbi:glycosyltransferase family 2 protein [Rufibacter tibetensis]|uniref:Glycosyl transferase family 2 n=1 Tax=Rufibacter tibetensis TaxID=512763 RepID=A0A0N7HWV6_9BACT|nr:glycosyltransferase family 2 protein [Rufibacter tibetensis]ALJ00313.1 glycosyl transferase family 2 [Rufibacter tibetensis]
MAYNSPKVAVVILNWNGRRWLEQFLPSVLQNSPEAEIVVADNASQDDSVSFLRAQYPQVRLIQLPENLGFCEGYNQALRQVEATYYVLLNSDVEVTPNWLVPMLDLLEKNPPIAACQPKIKSFHQRTHFEHAGAAGGFLDAHGYPFCRGRLFDTVEEDRGQYDDTRPVFWATGACLLIRAEAYWKASGFEKRFFAHMEEIDLCWRLQNLGYHIYYQGHSTVYHVGGGTLPKSNPRKTFLNFRNGAALLYKNLADAEVDKILYTRLVLDGVAATQYFLKGEWKEVKAIYKAHRAFLADKPFWKEKRKEVPVKKRTHELTGWSQQSVVWEYFVKGKKEFSALEIPDSAALPA